MEFVCERLDRAHDLSPFDSGMPELDEWLRTSAAHADRIRSARTFVWHDGGMVACAYFSLSGHLLAKGELPPGVRRGSPDVVPAILLARLALDQRLHGRGLGGELLLSAFARAYQADQNAAARFLVVDAIDSNAGGFYEHYGFVPIPGVSRLVLKMSVVEAVLARASAQ